MSMIAGEVAEPYATALMSLAQSKNLTSEMGDSVRSLLNLLENSEELQQFLANPVVNPDAKKAVISQILGDEANPYMRNFLMLLVDRSRILFLDRIGQQYLALLRKLNNVVLAEVTSAVELNDGQKETLVQRVKEMSNATDVEIQTKIDPSLIGGVIIKIGSEVIDASLRGQLRRIGVSLS
ncbi:MAG: ATP synthase F1 subunit delta [Microcoleaceae cyanobacterium]